jgi:hypothetical protein
VSNRDWKNDPAAYHEWERRNRALIIVPAAPVEPASDRFNPAMWDIDPAAIKPGKSRHGSN